MVAWRRRVKLGDLGGGEPGPQGFDLILETGVDRLLLEDNSFLLLESN